MKKQKNYISSLLLVISLISIPLSIFFANKWQELKNEIDTLKSNKITIVAQSDYDAKIKQIDSLILQNNYTKASTLLNELSNDSSSFKKQGFNLRKKMINDVINLKEHPITKYKEKPSNKPILTTATGINFSKTSKDSLVKALKTSSSKIADLKKQLTKEKSDDHPLEFKTSKGTKLYYVGDISNNMANGYGVAILESGSRYEGQWKNNLRHGEGHFFWNDGQHYKGYYKSDKRDGYGIYYWGNGDKYEGQWKDDKRNGIGKFYNKKGKLKANGTWVNDVLISEEK